VVALVTTRHALAEKVSEALAVASRDNPIAEVALRRNGALLVASSPKEAAVWVNCIAPEHLTIDDESVLPLICNAGSIFVGDYAAQSAGDYAAGPNHVLPTAGAARFRGGLAVNDFVKLITVQRFTADGLKKLAPAITTLADAEGLRAHAESVRVRCDVARQPAQRKRVAHA
jgi:histidinol dehydrogenase